MKLRDITNSECDVRKYMSIEIPDEVRYELENWDYDVDDVLGQARIYIDGHKLDDEIIPFNVEKHLELNSNQQIVLEWLKSQGKRRPIMTIADFADAYYGLEGAPVAPLEILSSYEQLSDDEVYQLLAAFAEWGKKEVAE
ncbi:hypothetical protein [Enterococcus malodoratus]|uniref:hypothetical protein n=1 Tax=Enterococcus malodoratus TaxID=71451 RepID=UPI002072F446|nr:hypothetical protein [Enterococcus malodoratus]